MKGVRAAKGRSKVSNGTDILPGIDQRSAVCRRYRDIYVAIINDQGGAERLAEARMQLIRRFSATCVMAEQMEAKLADGETINITEHALLTSSLVRVGAKIGINRSAKEIVPTLANYLEETPQNEEEVV